MKDVVSKFESNRSQLNDLVLKKANLSMKRFFSLDQQVYSEDTMPVKYKELIGLVASLVLKCDDCVYYHLRQVYQLNVAEEELIEALSIGLIVGGSITIPHLRRAIDFWEQLKIQDKSNIDEE